MNYISPILSNIISSKSVYSEIGVLPSLNFKTDVSLPYIDIQGNLIDKNFEKKFVDLTNKNPENSYVHSVKRASNTSFTNSKFNNIPRNRRSKSKRSSIFGSKPRNIGNSVEEKGRIISYNNLVLANQSEQNFAASDYLADNASHRLKTNKFYPEIFTDIKIKIESILRDLQTSQADKQWEELARALKDLYQYQYKVLLDYKLWQDTFQNIFKAISQNRITTKRQFDVFSNWVQLVANDTPIGLVNNLNQPELYLTRLHEILISSNEEIQKGMEENSNTLFGYEFFKKLSDAEYRKLKGKLLHVIRESFNTCERLGEKGHYYFIRNILSSCKSLIQSTKQFALKEDVLSVLKDQFKIFYQQTTLTVEQQTVVKQLSYLILMHTQEQEASLSEFCQKFTVKDMYPYERKVYIEHNEISIYSALPLEGEQFERMLKDLRKTHTSFKNAFNNLMDTVTHKVNIFIAKSKSAYETFNYALLKTSTGNGGSLNYFTPPILNRNILSYSSPPSITIYKSGGRIHNLEHEYNHALFDFYVNFREDGFKDLLTKYNFNWLNEGLSYVLDPNYSGKEDCKRYLTRHASPKIESIITALNQDYTISYIFTEYLLNKQKSVLVEILASIKNQNVEVLENRLRDPPSLESEFRIYIKERWSLRTIVTAEDGVEYDVKIKMDQVLKRLQHSQTDSHWESLATTLRDLNKHRNNVDYNVLRDSFEGVFQAISHINIATKPQFNAFKNWLQLVSDETLPFSLQKKPTQAKMYLSRLHEILTSSNPEIQDGVDSTLFYYDFFEKLLTPVYTELKKNLEDVIQATFKKCEDSRGEKNYDFIKAALNTYEKLIQSVKKSAYKEEVLNLLKKQFEIFYQQTKLTAEQQITIRKLSYVILSSARENTPLSEFCQKFTFKDLYPYEEKVSIENIEVSIYSALPLNSKQSDLIRKILEQANLYFRTAFNDTVNIKDKYKGNLLIADDRNSYLTYYYPLLIASYRDSLLDYLQRPTADTYEIERKLDVRNVINRLLYSIYIEGPIEESGEYNFTWLSEGLAKLLMFPSSNQENEILAKLQDKSLFNIQNIISGMYQDYEFSLALTYYLCEEHKQVIDKILFYGKTGQKDLLKNEVATLVSLDGDFQAFWSTRLENYLAKMREIGRLQDQLSRIQQIKIQRLKKQSQEIEKLDAKRRENQQLQDQLILIHQQQDNQTETARNQIMLQLNDLHLEMRDLESQQTEIVEEETKQERKYQSEKRSIEDQLQRLKYQVGGNAVEKQPTIRYRATTSKATQSWTLPNDAGVFKKTTSSRRQSMTNYVTQKVTAKSKDAIKETVTPIIVEATTKGKSAHGEWTPAKGWKAVKTIAGISAAVFYPILAAVLSVLMFKRKEIERKTRSSRKRKSGKLFTQDPKTQQPLLHSKPVRQQSFYQKNMRSSQRNTQV